ncbi:hypothetical protein B0O99DRAFT_687186 [Bisporella sp. PMI_857]|nr:hypothetical protein B0O99DRAFT_687186 [Bisporella sp. PMI_857]
MAMRFGVGTHWMFCTHWITSAKANGKLPAAAIILDVYSKSPVGSGIRKYAARMLHYILSEEEDGNNYWPVEDIKDILHESADLTVDLLTLMRAQVPGERVKDPRDMPLCDFHSHEEGEICIDATPWSVY